MTQQRNLELEEIRSIAFEALKNFESGNTCGGFGGLQQDILVLEIECIAASRGLIPIPSGSRPQDARANEEEFTKILEVISNLMTEGIIMWGMNRSNMAPPFMSVTSYGKKVLSNLDVNPHDPDGYIRIFKTKVPNASSLILMYLIESVQTFRNNNLLASSVMLGVASEAAFEVIFNAVTNALTGTRKQKLEKLANNIRTKQKFDEMMKDIVRIKSRLPQDIQDNVESELNGIFNLIRYQRNDTGHPTGRTVSRDEVFVSLRLFIMYCAKVYQIVDWLSNNQI